MFGRCIRLLFIPASLALIAGHPARGAAQSIMDRLSVHGYLTQAYAITDTGLIMGIPTTGTSDYRRAALLLRYAISSKEAFVVQVAHRRLGESPTNQFEQDVTLDWVYYERKFGGATALRVGKEPIPMGIYNETRYVGTLLPFYRAPFGPYQEGSFTSETLNGVSLSHHFRRASPWSVDAYLYGGSYNSLQFWTLGDSATGFQYTGAPLVSKNVVGAQLWLNTPVEGLRLGLGGLRHDDYGGVFFPADVRQPTTQWQASFDGKFDRLTTRAEYQWYRQSATVPAPVYTQKAWYAHVGYRVYGPISVNLQHDQMGYWFDRPGAGPNLPDLYRDNGVGVNYAFNVNILAKFEFHDADGYEFEQVVDLNGPPAEGKYVIASLSMSF